jgi:CDP-diacylglycerol--serine O-phosphatidyltransferase
VGAASVAFSATGNFSVAALLVLLAAVLDFLDGFVARLLKSGSLLGKQLDSLADIVSFGFAPAFMLHMYLKKITLQNYLSAEIGFIGFEKLIIILAPFLITVFAAVRLAIFNIDEKQKERFTGLPVPAVALFFISAIYSMQNQLNNQLFIHEFNWVIMVVVFSILMVISFPMFSLKFEHYRWKGNEIQYVFIGISLILLVTLQTIGISLAVILYIFLSVLMNVLHINR